MAVFHNLSPADSEGFSPARIPQVVEEPSRRGDSRSFRSRSRERALWGEAGRIAHAQVVRRSDSFRDRELDERFGYDERRALGGR